MKKFVISSMRKDAGKTSLIVGLAKASDGSLGYLKPFGDRLLYRKKRLWDYDSAVALEAMGIEESPEELSLGFDHSKLRFMYDEEQTKAKLTAMADDLSPGKDVLLIEGGSDMIRGISVHLDALSVCRTLNARLLVVLAGHKDQIADDAVFLNNHIKLREGKLAGVILNKIQDPEDFQLAYGDLFRSLDIPVLGILPYVEALTYPSVQYIADALFGKVITGESNLDSLIKRTFVGAMSGDAVLRLQRFKVKDKLVITSGDRSDMVLAALDTESAGIVLTNNILPPPNVIARANERQVPLIQVQFDTFQTAKKVDALVPLL
ncbi:MAG: DRTGG domain-containing protein, partial [Fidelibacterota bacterium]